MVRMIKYTMALYVNCMIIKSLLNTIKFFSTYISDTLIVTHPIVYVAPYPLFSKKKNYKNKIID